jgi:hypothetical protein
VERIWNDLYYCFRNVQTRYLADTRVYCFGTAACWLKKPVDQLIVAITTRGLGNRSVILA